MVGTAPFSRRMYHHAGGISSHGVCTANRILAEKRVDPELVASFEYYVKLYHIYFDWQAKGRKGSFYEQCQKEGIEYKGIPTIYYQK